MADLKLFRVGAEGVVELEGSSVAVEKSLQSLIERHLPALLGVRFLASEHPTGKTHAGRIDTLGIDEDGSPVIIEYKRALNENVINQGLFYMDWLVDHKAEFELIVMRSLGAKQAESIEWSSPRLLCVAGDFTRYDVHAVQQMNRNIELIRYRRYGQDMILFELLTAPGVEVGPTRSTQGPKEKYKNITEQLTQVDEKLRDRFEALKAFL